MNTRFAALAIIFVVCRLVSAQPGADNPVTLVVAPVDTVSVVAGDTVLLQIPLRVSAGFHVNANPPSSDDYIPLTIRFDSSAVFRVLTPQYPKGTPHRLEGINETLLVYNGAVSIPIPIVCDDNASAGLHTLKGTIEFQSCDDRLCFMPDERPIRATIVVK